ncbi:response regulator receiver protein [Denitrovibrio acetiphilus DSM 12809]|uniref:Response regulator receiver protein n=1 Tax=Denitrovibrio acetiphilus (strain DSM 12809 / NBRC 114555 / N2460) TaxID=522772 RepID=D4H5M8_DENA2|nr:response regulator [Denitrovibrio acetiphilus]ADD69469.1 response regulator receiver protein [Denitrovibrio acetiphilus DSM 12809]
MKVFVVDDNELHLKMCKILLNNLGYEVTTSTSLEDLQKRMDGLSEPDVALIDYRLSPGETGVDVLSYLKQNGKWQKCKLVALTADISERSMLERAGFDSVVFKPITEALLKEIIN